MSSLSVANTSQSSPTSPSDEAFDIMDLSPADTHAVDSLIFEWGTNSVGSSNNVAVSFNYGNAPKYFSGKPVAIKNLFFFLLANNSFSYLFYFCCFKF